MLHFSLFIYYSFFLEWAGLVDLGLQKTAPLPLTSSSLLL